MLPVPKGWRNDSSNIITKFHSDIGVNNIWINEHSNAVLIQYTTVTTVKNNRYVELYENPRKIKSRFRQIKNLLCSDEKEIEMKVISMADKDKYLIAKVSSEEQAIKEAYKYMNNNPNTENKQYFK